MFLFKPWLKKGVDRDRLSYDYNNQSKCKPQDRCTPIRIQIVDDYTKADDNDHRRKEQKHWRRTTSLGVGSLILSVLAFCTSAAAAFIAWRAMVADNRAWVSLIAVKPGPKEQSGHLLFQNLGRSPALGVRGRADRYDDAAKALEDAPRLCNAYQTPGAETLDIGRTLFPGPNLDDPNIWRSPLDGRKKGGILATCVVYSLSYDLSEHYSIRVFSLDERNKDERYYFILPRGDRAD